MPDTFKETRTVNYGSRIISSIKNIFMGFIVFLLSFVLLYWNEGRVNLANIAKTATQISSEIQNKDANLNGALISTTGVATTDESIDDGLFLKTGKYMAISRKVEMFAWDETRQSKTKTNIGGSETTEDTYTYEMKWTENPWPSNKFRIPTGHENPPQKIKDEYIRAKTATIGVYKFNPQTIQLPAVSPLPINAGNTTLKDGAILTNDGYVYIKANDGSAYENPIVGDMRIYYETVPSTFRGTIFGALRDNSIEQYKNKDGDTLYRAFIGSHDDGITAMNNEYVLIVWLLRLGGFIAMWLGLSSLFGPISVLLDVLPMFGSLSRFIIGFTTLVISLILSTLTIFISSLFHSFLVPVFIAIASIVLIAIGLKTFLKKKKTAIA